MMARSEFDSVKYDVCKRFAKKPIWLQKTRKRFADIGMKHVIVNRLA